MVGSLRHIYRLAWAGIILARYDVSLPATLRRRIPAPLSWIGRFVRAVARKPAFVVTGEADRLSAAFIRLGPAYVKLGQFLATRPDILGPELARDLSALQDRMPPFDQVVARRAVETAFDRPLHEIFGELGPPIAAASIAQVHKARLPDTAEHPGQTVAVKILRPDVVQSFRRDLEAFAFAAKQIDRFWPNARRLEPVTLVETLADSVSCELDLRLEAAAASEMADLTNSDPEFNVPAVDWSRTAKTVLTTEWIDGIALSNRKALENAGFDLAEIARRLMHSFLNHALRDGVFHADMHPGNLFVTRAFEDGPPIITAVDFGIVGRLDRTMRRFMAETLFGFLTRDYMRVAHIHFDVGFVPKSRSKDAFAQALRAVGEPVFGRDAEEISMARLLGQLFEITRLFDMHLQPQLVMLQKTMVVVEGVARSLDPQLNLWRVARPIVEDWMTRELGPEARVVDAAETAVSFARAARRAPDVLDKMEQAVDRLNGTSISREKDGAVPHSDAERKAGREARLALWISAAALAALALVSLS